MKHRIRKILERGVVLVMGPSGGGAPYTNKELLYFYIAIAHVVVLVLIFAQTFPFEALK